MMIKQNRAKKFLSYFLFPITPLFHYSIIPELTWGVRRPFGLDGAFPKIDLLLTPFASMFPVKLVRENLEGLSAVGTFTGKGFQILKLFKTRAMERCGHWIPPRGK